MIRGFGMTVSTGTAAYARAHGLIDVARRFVGEAESALKRYPEIATIVNSKQRQILVDTALMREIVTTAKPSIHAAHFAVGELGKTIDELSFSKANLATVKAGWVNLQSSSDDFVDHAHTMSRALRSFEVEGSARTINTDFGGLVSFDAKGRVHPPTVVPARWARPVREGLDTVERLLQLGSTGDDVARQAQVSALLDARLAAVEAAATGPLALELDAHTAIAREAQARATEELAQLVHTEVDASGLVTERVLGTAIGRAELAWPAPALATA